MVEKGFSGRRQLNAVGAAMYQRNADLLFEIPDLPAERWLRSVQLLLGGNGQTAGIGHGDEVTEMPQLHSNLPYLASMGPAYKVFFRRASGFYSIGGGICLAGRAQSHLDPSGSLRRSTR